MPECLESRLPFRCDKIRWITLRPIFTSIYNMFFTENVAWFIIWVKLQMRRPLALQMAWILHTPIPLHTVRWIGFSSHTDECGDKSDISFGHTDEVQRTWFAKKTWFVCFVANARIILKISDGLFHERKIWILTNLFFVCVLFKTSKPLQINLEIK